MLLRMIRQEISFFFFGGVELVGSLLGLLPCLGQLCNQLGVSVL